jgi:prepilin-type N-terminal cleavage/methylation domain-containing protein
MDRRQRPNRAGFTLVEVLVVILILATLIALLLPAVIGAVRKAREAQVSAELNNLATALASFKNTYGDYPPSRVILCERGYTFAGVLTSTATIPTPLPDGNCSDITVGQLAQRSLLYLRKFWPRVDFLSDPGVNAVPGTFNDFNGNRVVDSVGATGLPYVVLSGSECLAFFLGGIPINTGSGYGTSGFSKSPIFPFVDSLTANNRTVPNYEFNLGRLQDLDNDHFPSYLDPINTTTGSRRAYAYFSSYGTNSYDPNDVNGYDHNPIPSDPIDYEPDPNGTSIAEWGFTVGLPVVNSAGAVSNYAVSPAPNPYTSGPSAASTVSWINPNSFQIIYCGQDQLWGYGGAFIQSGIGAGGPLPLLSGNVNADTSRVQENDNLTNFSGGRLN